jgi:hypothetical protein
MSFVCKLYLFFLNIFKYLPFLLVIMISIVCVTLLYVCSVFSIGFEYLELPLFLIARLCSLLNVLPVCLMYFSVQSRNLIGKCLITRFIELYISPLQLTVTINGCGQSAVNYVTHYVLSFCFVFTNVVQ